MIILGNLPHDHKLRNVPLISISAMYKHKSDKAYRTIEPNFGIAKKTYNDLADVWTNDSEFITELCDENID